MISFTFTPIDLTSLYKEQYSLGRIDKATLRSYVTYGFITKDQFQEISGDSYEAQA